MLVVVFAVGTRASLTALSRRRSGFATNYKRRLSGSLRINQLFFRKFVEQIGRLFALTVAFARVTGSRSITIDVDCMPKASDSRTKVGDCMTNL